MADALPVSRPGSRFTFDGVYLRAESFYQLATSLHEVGADPGWGGDLHAMSHGESFLSTIHNRFGARGTSLIFIDEPEGALSPTFPLSLMLKIQDLAAIGSQFILASHSQSSRPFRGRRAPGSTARTELRNEIGGTLPAMR